MNIEITASGIIDDRDCAFPGATQLPDGTILCSYSAEGDGPEALGRTDFSESVDGGITWKLRGTIMEVTRNPFSSNSLKLSRSMDGKRIYAYGTRSYRKPDEPFGVGANESVLLFSDDNGGTWSEPQVLPNPYNCPLEISHSLCVTHEGLLLAPAALLTDAEHLGEAVIARISEDDGCSWPIETVIFKDPEGKRGYFEQKITEYAPGKLIATAWTVTLGDYKDCENSYALSEDGGRTWSEPKLTGIMGQTMTPVPLGNNRLLVLYNRRYGRQGIVMLIVSFNESAWDIEWEGILYDAAGIRDRIMQSGNGIDEFADFAFGFPTAICLNDGSFLATFWCKENGKYIIRYNKLRIL